MACPTTEQEIRGTCLWFVQTQSYRLWSDAQMPPQLWQEEIIPMNSAQLTKSSRTLGSDIGVPAYMIDEVSLSPSLFVQSNKQRPTLSRSTRTNLISLLGPACRDRSTSPHNAQQDTCCPHTPRDRDTELCGLVGLDNGTCPVDPCPRSLCTQCVCIHTCHLVTNCEKGERTSLTS